MNKFSLLAAAIAVAVAAAGQAAAQDGSANHGKIMGCYFGSWAFYRPGLGKFDVPDIDPTLCTHGFYGFADIDENTYEIRVWDPWYDLGPQDCGAGECNYDSYRRFVALKQRNPDFKPMISVGGWTAGSKEFSEMARDPGLRAVFIDSVVAFLQKFGFEGLDFDWEYPGFFDGSDEENDRDNFSALIRELAERLHPLGYLLSSAMSPGYEKIPTCYDLPELNKHFDFVNVMTYDYHGYWKDREEWDHREFTGHNAPMISTDSEMAAGPSHPGYMYNVFDSVNLYIDGGMDASKIVLGMPLYGRGWELVDPTNNGIYCPTDAGVPWGPYTQQVGIWGYEEVLQAQYNTTMNDQMPEATPGGWQIVVDSCYQAPYMTNGPYWVSYDDPDSLTLKAQFANHMGLAGAFVWSVDTDDFHADNSPELFPLMRAINRALASGLTYTPSHPCVGSAPMCEISTPAMDCQSDGQRLPHPTDCHKYYECSDPDGDGLMAVEEHDCGDWFFDPALNTCVDPERPGNEGLCPEEA